MKKIVLTTPFLHSFRNRVAPNPLLVKMYHQKIKLFIKDRTLPELYDHALEDRMQGYRSFSIGYDLRVIYRENPKSIIFIDIGTHPQVYK